MMVRFTPFEPWHLDFIEVQGAQAAEFGATVRNPAIAGALRNFGVAVTAYREDKDGRAHEILGAGGVLSQWRGRAIAWALVGKTVRPYEWAAITRRVRAELDAAHRAGIWRIEAQADATFPPALRWLEMLGFEREAKLEAYGPTGHDCIAFRRLRRDLIARES